MKTVKQIELKVFSSEKRSELKVLSIDRSHFKPVFWIRIDFDRLDPDPGGKK